jgi:hypothetical protein
MFNPNTMPPPTMHLLECNPEAKTIVEIREEQWNRDPGCHYIKTEGKCVEVPVLASGGLDYLVWRHPDWEPPIVAESTLDLPARPNSATAPLTPEQQALLDHYRQADAAFWQAHDAYRQALDTQSKARAACRAAGINLAEHL